MEKKRVILLDTDTKYLQGIKKFIVNNHEDTVDVMCYTELSNFIEDIEAGISADILCVDKTLYSKEFDEVRIDTICILSIDNENDSIGNHAIISKYQTGPTIFENILRAEKDNKERKAKEVAKELERAKAAAKAKLKEDERARLKLEDANIEENVIADDVLNVEAKINVKENIEVVNMESDVLDLLYDEIEKEDYQEILNSRTNILVVATEDRLLREFIENNDVSSKYVIGDLNHREVKEMYTKVKYEGNGYLFTAVYASVEDYLDIIEFKLITEEKLPYELVSKMLKKVFKKAIYIQNDNIKVI